MFGLPDLTPRDSHSIWYTSSRNPIAHAALLEAHEQSDSNNGGNSPSTHASRRAGQLLIERSALAHLRAEEQTAERRRLAVQNFGSAWLKPPGVPKTLHQIREEKREQEEHAEAMRREQLAQELAEAEAGGAEGVLADEGDAEEEEEQRDLDAEIPDAGEESFGFDGGDDEDMDSDEEESGDDDDDDDDENEDDVRPAGRSSPFAWRNQVESEDEGSVDEEARLLDARMRMEADSFRQAVARGDDGEDMFGTEEELEAETRGQILDEEALLAGDEEDLGVDMDADLDDEIPEAGELSGVYEHTDSEDDLSSSSVEASEEQEEEEEEEEGADRDDDDEEEEEGDVSFAPRVELIGAPMSPTEDRGQGPRSSLDLSGLLSVDESSLMDSSPNVRAGRR
ncbi:hypothetical protein CCHL11_04732 [Colletotrichum chlorophyti]|uniref:Replicase polyprotein 1a n=1 Tax=Colletotrichum chlorophyti TaxID=708187 RepID=A0A1Q8S1F8_9PEZI|nr:hypothetical protein CCHL11_04732 [Colletotrichum chlorophyti]